ncbi:hypothetical protein [Paenisporosarcina quisquiliarum]|uniref:hypothetical protein n=1 Tax=Paenisporosarcina quisquiliarum TaxID=365346 RepID=UPI0037366A57
MAKSNASKKRAHQLRNTGRDASEFRGQHVMSTHVRKTKSKQEQLYMKAQKHKKQFRGGYEPYGIAFYYVFNRFKVLFA